MVLRFRAGRSRGLAGLFSRSKPIVGVGGPLAGVLLLGIDDHDSSGFFGLTTVAEFPELRGRLAVTLLMDELRPGRRSLGS